MFNVKNAGLISVSLISLISIFYFLLFKFEYDGILLSVLKFNTIIAFICISPILYIVLVNNFNLSKKKIKHIIFPILMASLFNLYGSVFYESYELPITVLEKDKIIKNVEHLSNNFGFSKKIIATIKNEKYLYKVDMFKMGDLIKFTTKRSHDDKITKEYLCNNKNKCILAIKYNENKNVRTPKAS